MDQKTAQHVADVLKAVAHPVRLQIIEALEHGEKCVGDLVERLDIQQAAVSQQLGLMKDKDIVAYHIEQDLQEVVHERVEEI